jgi:hypothetical protein
LLLLLLLPPKPVALLLPKGDAPNVLPLELL